MILTNRELFLLVVCAVTYVTLFVVTIQNSRRKILLLEKRLRKIHDMQQAQQAISSQNIAANQQRIEQLQAELQQLGSENSMLRLQMEERKTQLDYANKMAQIEQQKRGQAETVLFASDVYLRMQRCIADGRSMSQADWQELATLTDSIYTGFTDKLYSLYSLSQQDYRVCLLIKARVQPKDIATLTAHSKESIASTRSRLYAKIFGRKGTTRDWDNFILSI